MSVHLHEDVSKAAVGGEERVRNTTPTESEEQQTLFRWAAMQCGKYPELALMFHIPNEGKRSWMTGGRMKAEGLKSGVPDIFLPVPRFTGFLSR